MRKLPSDTRGAVMILALFMALVGIGFLYYLTGLGDAILAQERMQDAADATAFSSAVIHARGMNILALINILMASILAILVLLSMVASVLNVVALALAVAGIFFPPFEAAALEVKVQAEVVKNVERSLKGPVEVLLTTLHKVQGPLRKAIPVLASFNAEKLSVNSYGDVVDGGLTFPIFDGLPTQDGKFNKLCEEAGELAGAIAFFPIDAVTSVFPDSVQDFVKDFLGDRLESLGKTYAQFYCGDGPKPPNPVFTVQKALPDFDTIASKTCKSKDKTIPESTRKRSCKEFEKEVKVARSSFDFADGKCKGTREEIELCGRVKRMARAQCNPDRSSNRADFIYREVDVIHHFVIREQGGTLKVIDEKRDDGPGRQKKLKRRQFFGNDEICKAQLPLVSEGFGFGEWDESPSNPLCSTKLDVPTLLDVQRAGDNGITRTNREITDILHCTTTVKLDAKLSGDQASPKMKKQTPQEMCSCATLGEEMFQIRSVVFGDASSYTAESDQGILIATGGEVAEVGAIGSFAELAGRFASAQSEFYFDDDSLGREEWLWHMKWKARMRRLQIRPAFVCKEKKNTCPGAKSPTGASSKLTKIKALLSSSVSSIISH